jgi:hypothetical protein
LEDGLLVDPTTEWGRIVNPELTEVDLVAGPDCVVLLGEPGSGKSTAMRAAKHACHDARRRGGEGRGHEPHWLDLHDVGSSEDLRRWLFDHPVFASWKQGNGRLVLFLDSFDECRISLPNLPSILINELKDCPVDRLNLRIASRPGSWSAELEAGLRELWGDHSVLCRQLLPLRHRDVVQWAKEGGVNPVAFLTAVRSAGALPLAGKPLTLDFLVEAFRRDGALPERQADLYRSGCLRLCEESPPRREHGLPRLLEARQRLAVAERIAALTTFAGRAAVFVGLDYSLAHNSDLVPADIYGHTETDRGNDFPVTHDAVREALDTGLFVSHGDGRLGWTHRTHEEFLAASYLARREFALPQIASLVVHPDDASGRLVPQLYGVVGWLAGMRSDVLAFVSERDPEALLHTDLSALAVADRPGIVTALLAAIEHGQVNDSDWGIRRWYAGLAHPDLAGQLRPVFRDRTKDVIVRRVAMHVAAETRERALVDALVAVALNPAEVVHLRSVAARAVVDIEADDEPPGDGRPSGRYRLRRLVDIPAEEDWHDELKGWGLRAAWPRHLTAEELFVVLTPPDHSFSGAYRGFLLRGIADDLAPADFPTALAWALPYIDCPQPPIGLREVIDAVLVRALDHLGNPAVLDALARSAIARSRHLGRLLSEDPMDDPLDRHPGRRLRILAHAIGTVADKDRDLLYLGHLARPEDVPWMVDMLCGAAAPEKGRWARLIARLVRFDDRAGVEAVLAAREREPTLHAVTSPLFDAVELDSDQARQGREDYEIWREDVRQVESPLDPPPTERVAGLLERFQAGETDSWWMLNLDLTLEPTSSHYGDEFEADLTALPGWGAANTDVRDALVDAAERYAVEVSPRPETWVKESERLNVYRPDFAGFRALHLLLTRAPQRLEALPPYVWVKWAPVVAAYPLLNPSEADAAFRDLTALAHRHAPAETTATLMGLVGDATRRAQPVGRLLWRFAHCWDDRLAEAMLAVARDPATPATSLDGLLSDLLRVQSKAGAALAAEMVADAAGGGDQAKERAAVAAARLLLGPTDPAWGVVWPALTADADLAARVLWAVERDDRDATVVAGKLNDGQLADLYAWLVRRYPPSEDPLVDGLVTYRIAIGQWRDYLLTHLRNRGTEGACRALERLVGELPELGWLRWTLLAARRLTRQRTWRPLEPAEVMGLVASAAARAVRNADQLLDVVVESLGRLEDKLQRHDSPAAIDLWNEMSPRAGEKLYQPKNEGRFADYVKRHLDDDLEGRRVVVNREVANRRGERTDIYVQALTDDPADPTTELLTVVVETKGSWNRDLKSAMAEQLVGHYLTNSNIRHGIYLIGWFQCERWDARDYRRDDAPKKDIETARGDFMGQAAELSDEGRRVEAVIIDTALRY